MEYLQDETTFRQTEEDPNKLISEKVERWLEKWQGDEGLSEEACEWIKAHNPKPVTLYANIKTHKTDWRYRFIISLHQEQRQNIWLGGLNSNSNHMHNCMIRI